MEEGRERMENDPNVSLNDDTGDTGIQSNSQDNHRGFAQVVQIRSSSSFLSINPENSKALQMFTTDDVLAMQFDSFEVGESFYHKYASAVGFIVRKDDISRNKNGEIVMRRWVCNREGFRQRKYLENVNRRRDPRPSTRVNCPATFRISLDRVTHKWLVKEFVAEHTHELAPTCISHLQIDPPLMEVDKVKEKGMINVEAQSSQVMDYLVKQVGDCDQVGIGRQDLHNSINGQCRAEITISDVETALAYLSAKKDADPGLFYETKIVEGRLAAFFLADSVSQLDYACFGDVMAVYRTNAYKMHFVILAGLNHHHQTSVFGCALLDDDTVEAYTWLFQTFLHVMQGNMPISIVTDGFKAVCKAIQHVLPQSRRRLCTWHLERNAHSKSNVNDTSFISYFKVGMLEILSQDDFELKWKAMVDKYKLSGNPWIQKMYKKRHMWAEAYLRGHFWAGLQSTRVCEGINEHLSRFSQHKLKLYQFISQYDRAVDIVRCNEAKAEYDTTHVQFALSTPLVRIEKHAADVFTRESYKRFLSEMRLETLLFVLNKVDGSNHRIYTLGNYEHCNLVYEVVFEPSGPSLRCSCLKFETSGFPCSHAIHIIKSERLEEIPQNLIHPRWTKSAKSRAQFWQRALPPVSGDVIMRMVRHGSLASSFSSLCYLGSKSDQAYNILCCELRKLKHKIEEHSAIGSASKSGGGALSTPTTEKDVNPVSKIARSKSSQLGNGNKRRKIQREGQSRNVERIKYGCPNLINATISVVDSNPIVVQDTLDTSSDSDMELGPRFDQGRDPVTNTYASHLPASVEVHQSSMQ